MTMEWGWWRQKPPTKPPSQPVDWSWLWRPADIDRSGQSFFPEQPSRGTIFDPATGKMRNWIQDWWNATYGQQMPTQQPLPTRRPISPLEAAYNADLSGYADTRGVAPATMAPTAQPWAAGFAPLGNQSQPEENAIWQSRIMEYEAGRSQKAADTGGILDRIGWYLKAYPSAKADSLFEKHGLMTDEGGNVDLFDPNVQEAALSALAEIQKDWELQVGRPAEEAARQENAQNINRIKQEFLNSPEAQSLIQRGKAVGIDVIPDLQQMSQLAPYQESEGWGLANYSLESRLSAAERQRRLNEAKLYMNMMGWQAPSQQFHVATGNVGDVGGDPTGGGVFQVGGSAPGGGGGYVSPEDIMATQFMGYMLTPEGQKVKADFENSMLAKYGDFYTAFQESQAKENFSGPSDIREWIKKTPVVSAAWDVEYARKTAPNPSARFDWSIPRQK